ncbi:hypothetical protein HQ520_01435, partial [bacterium]|nr:hypothetical protein [bacterium]
FYAGHLPDLEKGQFPPVVRIMEEVADYYGIPSIHMGLVAVEKIQKGEMIMTGPPPPAAPIAFSIDGVHPHMPGQELYRDAVARGIEEMLKQENTPRNQAIPAPLDLGNWENAKRIPLSDVVHSGGWQTVSFSAESVGEEFMNYTKFVTPMWKAGPGETLEFRFKGRRGGLYSMAGPDTGKATAVLDGGVPIPLALFDFYSFLYRIRPIWIGLDLPDAEHTMRVEISAETLDKAAELGGMAGEIAKRPELYGRSDFYVNDILILGEIVKMSQ